jgi:hypothetical protein
MKIKVGHLRKIIAEVLAETVVSAPVVRPYVDRETGEGMVRLDGRRSMPADAYDEVMGRIVPGAVFQDPKMMGKVEVVSVGGTGEAAPVEFNYVYYDEDEEVRLRNYIGRLPYGASEPVGAPALPKSRLAFDLYDYESGEMDVKLF